MCYQARAVALRHPRTAGFSTAEAVEKGSQGTLMRERSSALVGMTNHDGSANNQAFYITVY